MAISVSFDGSNASAVVTGAASGIGFTLVKRLLEARVNVVAADIDEKVLTCFDAFQDSSSSSILPMVIDVSNEADVERMLAACVSEFGRVDAIVNNAGLGGVFGKITEIDLEDWRSTYSVLVDGTLLGIKHAARIMGEQQGGGSIINMASAAGLSGGIGPLAYSSAKAGVVSMTANAAEELADREIRVNAICPGAIFTPMFSGEAAEAAVAAAQPWPQHGRPDDIANLVMFLMSDASAFITGQAYVIDGGLLAAGTRFRHLAGMLPDASGFAGRRGSNGQ